jgi:hypothetical protein
MLGGAAGALGGAAGGGTGGGTGEDRPAAAGRGGYAAPARQPTVRTLLENPLLPGEGDRGAEG